MPTESNPKENTMTDAERIERRYNEATEALDEWRVAARRAVEAEFDARTLAILADRQRDFERAGLAPDGSQKEPTNFDMAYAAIYETWRQNRTVDGTPEEKVAETERILSDALSRFYSDGDKPSIL